MWCSVNDARTLKFGVLEEREMESVCKRALKQFSNPSKPAGSAGYIDKKGWKRGGKMGALLHFFWLF